MNKIRKTYLLTGGFHPVGQIISILHYGRKIAQVEGTRCLIGWSEDGNRLECNQEFIRMEDFRGYSHKVLQEAHELMSRIMFGWDPVPNNYYQLYKGLVMALARLFWGCAALS